MYNNIIFIDFDGTITAEDTLVGALKLLVSKEEFEEKNNDLLNNKVTLSKILNEAFEKTLSSRESEIIEYIKTVPIRAGFEEFLDYTKSIDIPVVVISGGLSTMLDIKIEKYKDKILDTYCVELDTSGEYMKLNSKYDDGIELLKKTDIMKQYKYKTAICIGDSHTDVKMSMASDVVFARDLLVDYMKKMGKNFYEWNDFFDIIEMLKNILALN